MKRSFEEKNSHYLLNHFVFKNCQQLPNKGSLKVILTRKSDPLRSEPSLQHILPRAIFLELLFGRRLRHYFSKKKRLVLGISLRRAGENYVSALLLNQNKIVKERSRDSYINNGFPIAEIVSLERMPCAESFFVTNELQGSDVNCLIGSNSKKFKHQRNTHHTL